MINGSICEHGLAFDLAKAPQGKTLLLFDSELGFITGELEEKKFNRSNGSKPLEPCVVFNIGDGEILRDFTTVTEYWVLPDRKLS